MPDITALDDIRIRFDEDSLFLLNITLAIIMFGVALEIKKSDIRKLWQQPRLTLVGLSSQFVLLPLFSFGLVYLLSPPPSVALGMLLIAACPGGNISNFMSHLSGGNTALSVGLTSVATFLALFFTPFNLQFYGQLYPPTAALLQSIELDAWEVGKTVFTIILLPLLLGIWVQFRWPLLSQRMAPYFRVGSILIFIGFVGLAFAKNWDLFLAHVSRVALLVLIHNTLALALGYYWAKLNRLGLRERRSLSIETGIQNSGLGLVIIFGFFDGLGGMALVTAWWSIHHIISGLALAFFWSRKPIAAEA